MAKKIDGYIKLQVPAGKANPSPPIGPALGQRGVNIMAFCKEFNAATQKLNQVFQSCSDYCVQRQVVHIHHENSSSFYSS